MRDMLVFQWYLPLSVSPFTEIESDKLYTLKQKVFVLFFR